MSWLVAAQTGNLSTAPTWYLVDHFQVPSTYAAAGVSLVDSSNPLYTPYFTPTSTSVSTVGVALYVAYVNSASSSNRVLTCDLMDGATAVATATANFIPSASDTTGGTSGMVSFKFATPFTYTSTTASNWRYRITSSGAGTNNRIYFRSGASGVAYFEVTSATQAPVNGDSLIITGHLTSAGTNTSVKVTVDASLTIGTNANEGLFIGKGGMCSYGDSQAAAYTITLATDCFVRCNSSKTNEYGYEMGNADHPLTVDYLQKVIYTPSADGLSGFIPSDQYTSYAQYNYDSARVSIVGNYNYCRNSEDNDYSLLASGITTGGNQIVLTDDMAVTANSTVFVLGTTTASDGEEMGVTSYNPATKTITTSSNFTKDHAAGTRVYIYNYNARFESSSSTATFYMIAYNSKRYTRGNYYYIKNLTIVDPYATHFGSSVYDAIDRTSSFQNLHIIRPEGYFLPRAMSQNIIVIPDSLVTASAAGTYVDGLAVLPILSQTAPTLGAGTEVHNIYLASAYVILESGCKIYDGEQFDYKRGIVINASAAYDIEVHDVVFGLPLANSSSDILTNASGGTIISARFINCGFNSAVGVDEQYLKLALNSTNLFFQLYNQKAGDHRIYTPEGIIRTCGAGQDDTTTKTSGQPSLGFYPYTDGSGEKLKAVITKALAANQTVALYGFVRKNAAYGALTRPTIAIESSDGNIDTEYTMTDVDDTWKFFSVAGQIGASGGYLTITLSAQSLNASAAAYFADMQLVIGDASSGVATVYKVGTLWRGGEPTADDALGGTVDATYLANAMKELAIISQEGKYSMII